jgi:hypothetical protein
LVLSLPTDPKKRKDMPIARGVLDYFPDAIAAVAEVSRIGNDQHNPGQPMHWAREKSTDHADCIIRHMIERGGLDTDGQRHSAKLAWRALALLQTEIEDAEDAKPLTATEVISRLLHESGAHEFAESLLNAKPMQAIRVPPEINLSDLVLKQDIRERGTGVFDDRGNRR